VPRFRLAALRWQAATALFTADQMCHILRRLWQQRWQATAFGRIKIALTRFSSTGDWRPENSF
jgi:hypothetical protein